MPQTLALRPFLACHFKTLTWLATFIAVLVMHSVQAQAAKQRTPRKEVPKGKSQAVVPRQIIIPTAAVRESGGKKSIFIVFEGKATEKSVKLGNPTSKGVEVADGLIGGEEIVVNPPPNLKNGDRVLVKQKQG